MPMKRAMKLARMAEPHPQPRSPSAQPPGLRLHLDELPDRFLTGLAFMLARNRYSCAESLIGANFGGTLMGGLARSVLVDGLRWLWVARDPSRRACLLGDLLNERSGASLANIGPTELSRLLMPVPPVADLGGASRTWLDASSIPGDDALLDELTSPVATPPAPDGHSADLSTADGAWPTEFLARAHQMLDLAGLRGAAMVLAHAGHGNYLGQRSALTADGVPGFDLRADHEALFMHTPAVGVFAVLVGSHAVAPDLWPAHVERVSFLKPRSSRTMPRSPPPPSTDSRPERGQEAGRPSHRLR
jgi:hypothetical protein